MKKSNKQKEVIIMAESHVQLKREEVIGDEVVLTDISPSTNTESVVDLSTGLTLDEDLLRLWNAINNKLYRVVNSVNGRTGVVVLSAKDVGLDNVDNVSFADIQEWVLEQIEKLFGSHSFKLYESMDSVLIDISANDKMMSGTDSLHQKVSRQKMINSHTSDISIGMKAINIYHMICVLSILLVKPIHQLFIMKR